MKDEPFDLTDPSYTPVRLLNEAAFWLGAMSDAELALMLGYEKAIICRVRFRSVSVSAGLMVRIMDCTGWHVTKVRELAGIPFDGPLPPTEPKAVAVLKARTKQRQRVRLTADMVRAIRLDARPRKQIAFDYGITPQHVGVVQRGGEAA